MLSSIRKRWIPSVAIIVVILTGLGIVIWRSRVLGPPSTTLTQTVGPSAPPDLEKLREPFLDGVAALQRNDGDAAVESFDSFTFGKRKIEEYRLYYLANGHQLSGNPDAARATLAKLWRRNPRLIYANDVAFHLGGLYEKDADWNGAADVYAAQARKSSAAAVTSVARWNAAKARLNAGDLSGAFFSARNLLIKTPAAAEAKDAEALVRTVSGIDPQRAIPFTALEKLERATALVAAGKAQNAIDELMALRAAAPALHSQIDVQRGLALTQLRQYEEANKVLEPLASGTFKTAIPAIRQAAKNHATIAAAIDPFTYKTVKERKKVGTVKVRVGKGKKRHTVTRPKYQTVFRKVKLVDLAKKKKKEEEERLASERLKDLLSLPLDGETRIETLNTLITRALEKNQDEYLRELVPALLKLDRDADPALQYFWDHGWEAWTRRDLKTAQQHFRFIADTYSHPNVKRQAEYWYARSIEITGRGDEASKIYQKLAAVPYADLYAIHAVSRGARREDPAGNPLKKSGPDWAEIAEKEMPDELRIAYELTALSATRDAFLEIRQNMNRANVRFAEALLAEGYYAARNSVLMYRSLRKAWPQLATVEQDEVPVHFLKMYYPMEFADEIEEHAQENGLDANLVRALILQESYYDPEAKSRVGATGLMQLMPATATDHARRLRIPFAASRLEDPDVNIQLGTYHIRMLLNLFNGNVYLAVASYNAGQGNVAKWRRAAPQRPMDEFVEAIPFPETRNYVKRVTMLRAAYRRMAV